jgi:hypothetical protein
MELRVSHFDRENNYLGSAFIGVLLQSFETASSLLTIFFVSVIGILICFGYVLARLFMIVETFRALFFLPPSAYIATWASNVPHIA